MPKVSDWTDDLPEHSRCIWQLTPMEVPKDMSCAFELWQVPDGKMLLFQFRIHGKRTGDWYNRVQHAMVFEQIR